MQAQYLKYEPEGFIQLTVLTQDWNVQPATQETAAAWAEELGVTHPVLADSDADTESSLVPEFEGYPTFVLYENGVVSVNTCALPGCIAESEIESVLP